MDICIYKMLKIINFYQGQSMKAMRLTNIRKVTLSVKMWNTWKTHTLPAEGKIKTHFGKQFCF